MSKELKALMADSYRRRYEGVSEACVVDVSRLNVAETMDVRTSLRHKGMRLNVVKNSLARRALAGGPLEALTASLEGPCAIAFGGESVIDLARTLARLAKDHTHLALRRGMLAGDPSLVAVEEIARFRDRFELLGDVAGLVAGPGRKVAACLVSPSSKIAGCLKAMIEQAGG